MLACVMLYAEHALVIHTWLHVAYYYVWYVIVVVCGQVALVWLCVRSCCVFGMVMHL